MTLNQVGNLFLLGNYNRSFRCVGPAKRRGQGKRE
jgi:hypothetical protein